MKLKVILQSDELNLPIHYNHMVQAALLAVLQDKDYQHFIHDEGYHYEKRTFKLFSFSKIMGNYRSNMKQKQVEFKGNIELVISSSQETFIRLLKEGLEEKGLRLGCKELKVKALNIHEEPLVGSYLKVESLSPIVAYSTVLEGEKKRTRYYGPLEPLFSQILRENIIKKYRAIYGEKVLEDEHFEVVPIATEHYKKSVIYYKNFIINGYNGRFLLIGNPVLIQLALEAGLGGKNAQGFGCIQVV